MALLGSKRLHMIVMDSRGKGLGDLIRAKIESNEIVDVIVRELVDVASKHLNGHPFDVVYIAGGACDITTKDRKSKEITYTWGEGSGLQEHLLRVLRKANASLKRYFPASKIVLCPLIASELNRVVSSGSATSGEQLAVEEAIWSFNNMIFKINQERGTVSPALHHQVHRFCKGKRRAYFHHLGDGLHPSDYLSHKWANEFIRIIAQN